MILPKELLDKMDLYEQLYFATDSPVPFKNGWEIYPVLSKDYYKFYSYLPCLTMDKNTKRIQTKNEKGEDIVKMVANPEGIGMSYLKYLITCMHDENYGRELIGQVTGIFSLALRISDGYFCPECGKEESMADFYKSFLSFQQEKGDFSNLSEIEKNIILNNCFAKASLCPECGSQMREIFSIKNENGNKQLCIYNKEITQQDLEEFTAIVTHQNILNYKDDRYIDPTLKEDLALKAKLENKNYSTPSLEKQLVCVSISSPYKIDELMETVTLRKLALMLRAIDSKNTYYAQIQGAMSGMVKFKEDPKHWIFGSDDKNLADEVMTLSSLQNKLSSVT